MFCSKIILQGQFSQEFQLFFFCHVAFYNFFVPEKCPEKKGQFLYNPETFPIEHKSHYHEDTQ